MRLRDYAQHHLGAWREQQRAYDCHSWKPVLHIDSDEQSQKKCHLPDED